MPYLYADNWQEGDFDGNDNNEGTTKNDNLSIRRKHQREKYFFCIFMFLMFIMFDNCE